MFGNLAKAKNFDSHSFLKTGIYMRRDSHCFRMEAVQSFDLIAILFLRFELHIHSLFSRLNVTFN